MINISASNFRKGLAIVIACLIWFALVSQFYLILLNRTKPVAETIITFLSYFTILSNLLVAISTTIILTRQHQQDNFFKRETTLTAIAVYITIVGIVYNLILRHIWNPTGLQSIVDHYCTQSRRYFMFCCGL
jgi:magnesium-transporting ATPase (P-type)